MKDNYKDLLSNVILKPESVIHVSDLKEGMWVVRKITNGQHCTFLMENVNDLPEALELARFEALRYEISKAITEYFSGFDSTNSVLEEFNKLRVFGVTIRGIVNSIFKALRSSGNVRK